jgi:hypothetical protein
MAVGISVVMPRQPKSRAVRRTAATLKHRRRPISLRVKPARARAGRKASPDRRKGDSSKPAKPVLRRKHSPEALQREPRSTAAHRAISRRRRSASRERKNAG